MASNAVRHIQSTLKATRPSCGASTRAEHPASNHTTSGHCMGDWLSWQPHLPRMALALAYKALPCAVFPFTAQKPWIFNSLRACFTASVHFFNALVAQFFFARAEAALLTIFPVLLLIKVSFVNPPTVFTFFPLKTATFASLPRAMMLTFLAFFMAFMPFIAAFMAGLRAAFIARAMTTQNKDQKG